MASQGEVGRGRGAAAGRSESAVKELFSSLEELHNDLKSKGEEEFGNKLLREAEVVAECLAYHTQQYTTATVDIINISGALWKAINSIVPLKKEVEGLRELSKNIKLIESGVDPAPIEIPPDFPSVGRRGRAPSYEDFKQSKLQEMGGGAPVNGGRSEAGSSVPSSPVPSFGIRKAKSDPDVNKHNMTKELESMRVDIKRLKGSEKKLLKDKQLLGRKCKLLEEERDRAEDRLKIEQTQRDSIEKLRQRNRELEDQVNQLKKRQVIKDQEKSDNN